MARELRVFQPVGGDAVALDAAFRDDPGTWLPGARAGDVTLRIRVRAGGLERTVLATVGQPWHGAGTTWRSLSWEPVTGDGEATHPVRVLPTLDGELGLHADDAARPTLVLDARYRPPGGLLGAALDAVALHRIARSTGERLLADVAAALRRLASERDAPAHAGPPTGG